MQFLVNFYDGHFQPKPVSWSQWLLCKNGPFAEKFDPAQISPFSMPFWSTFSDLNLQRHITSGTFPDVKMDHLQKSSIQLRFGHFRQLLDGIFRPVLTTSGTFPIVKMNHLTEKFDPAVKFFYFGNANLVRVLVGFS